MNVKNTLALMGINLGNQLFILRSRNMKRSILCLILALTSSINLLGMTTTKVEVVLKDNATLQVEEEDVVELLKVVDRSIKEMLEGFDTLSFPEISKDAFKWIIDNLAALNDAALMEESLNELFETNLQVYCDVLFAANYLKIDSLNAAGAEHSNKKLREAIGNPDKLDYLKDLFKLSRYPNVVGINLQNENGGTILKEASKFGDKVMVELLIKNGAKPDLPDIDDYTALIWAAKQGHTEVVKLLIEAGADLNLLAEKGTYTALVWAAFRGHAEVVKLLIIAGADPDIQDEKGAYTALIWAAFRGHTEVVRLLIIAGAKLDQPNNDGFTALHLATEQGHTEVVRLLILAGADPARVTKRVKQIY